jgi:hypothetical protein
MSQSPPKILAFSGKIGSGKNYLAENVVFDYLRQKNKNVQIIAFADYLKMICCVKDRILYERLFYDKDEVSRRELQTRGTLERKENKDIFVEILECKIRLAFDRKTDVIIVTDLRIKNEFQFIEKMEGVTFRINAPKRTLDKMMKECGGDKNKVSIVASHMSETDLDDCKKFNHVLSNDYENEENIILQLNEILDRYF